jgi:hypothetical protein
MCACYTESAPLPSAIAHICPKIRLWKRDFAIAHTLCRHMFRQHRTTMQSPTRAFRDVSALRSNNADADAAASMPAALPRSAGRGFWRCVRPTTLHHATFSNDRPRPNGRRCALSVTRHCLGSAEVVERTLGDMARLDRSRGHVFDCYDGGTSKALSGQYSRQRAATSRPPAHCEGGATDVLACRCLAGRHVILTWGTRSQRNPLFVLEGGIESVPPGTRGHVRGIWALG